MKANAKNTLMGTFALLSMTMISGCVGGTPGTVSFDIMLNENGQIEAGISSDIEFELRHVIGNAVAATSTPLANQSTGLSNEPFHYQSDVIQYRFNGVRQLPVDHTLMQNLEQFVASLPGSVLIVATSGGQPQLGTVPEDQRVGSTRHDVDERGYGQSVDFHLLVDGQVATPETHPALYADLIEHAARSHPGIGHYSWGVHVGGGAEAFWGPDTTSGTANPMLREAFARGREIANSN